MINLGTKIAIVMPYHIKESGGGAEVQANYLAIELAKKGFEVCYICETLNSKKINSIEEYYGYKIYWLKNHNTFPWLFQKRYFTLFKTINPRLIIQRMSSSLSYTINKFCKYFDSKYIWICTDDTLSLKYAFIKKYKRKYKISDIGLIKYIFFYTNNLISDIYRNKAMNGVDLAFTQNSFQKQNLINNYNLKSETMISGHPINPSLLSVKNKFNKKTILWCANLGKHKRPELFIKLASKFINTDYNFLMIGGHNDKKYVKSLFNNKPDNLRYIGKIDFFNTYNYFLKSSVFVNTSKSDGEGFPNTFIQSWLSGTPVLSFEVNPNKVITVNNLGIVNNDFDKILATLVTYLTDFSLYEKISTNSLIYSKLNHSLDAMTDNFLSCIKKNSLHQ